MSPQHEPEPPGPREGPGGELQDPAGGSWIEASVRGRPGSHYGRYVGVLGILIVVLITINAAVTKPNGATGIPVGGAFAPFAVPLVLGSLTGDANVATRTNEGAAGRAPACTVRGPQILNVCQLYENSPVVLALFVDAGSCRSILGQLQALAPSFPGVRFAAVAIKGERAGLRRLLRSEAISLPVGIDSDGALAVLYKVASCPQVSFAYPGGKVQSGALLKLPTRAALRARVLELVRAARARGWRGEGG